MDHRCGLIRFATCDDFATAGAMPAVLFLTGPALVPRTQRSTQ
jgi:hypothetical protein